AAFGAASGPHIPLPLLSHTAPQPVADLAHPRVWERRGDPGVLEPGIAGEPGYSSGGFGAWRPAQAGAAGVIDLPAAVADVGGDASCAPPARLHRRPQSRPSLRKDPPIAAGQYAGRRGPARPCRPPQPIPPSSGPAFATGYA